MEIEGDENIKVFEQLYFIYKGTNNFENPNLLAD